MDLIGAFVDEHLGLEGGQERSDLVCGGCTWI